MSAEPTYLDQMLAEKERQEKAVHELRDLALSLYADGGATKAATRKAVRDRAREIAKQIDGFEAETEAHYIVEAVFNSIDNADVAVIEAIGGRAKLIDLATVEAERITWWIHGYIPKGLSMMLAAPGGTVKGLYTMHVAKQITDEEAGPVLYLGSEDNLASIIKPRAIAAGIDPARFIPLRAVEPDGTERPLRFPRDVAILEDAVEQSGASLVVIDSGVEHLEEGLKSNSTEDVRRFMSPINDLCERRRVTVLIILHTNKTRDAAGTDRVSGARAWVDAQRHTLLAAPDDEDADVRHVEVGKTNISTRGLGRQFRIETRDVEVRDRDTGEMVLEPIPYLVDEGVSTKDVERLLRPKKERSEEEAEGGGVDDTILNFLADAGEPVESKEVDRAVSELAGVAERTARDHRLALSRRGWTEAVPETVGGAAGGRRKKWLTRLSATGWAVIGREPEGPES